MKNNKLIIWNSSFQVYKGSFFQRTLGAYLVASWLRKHGVEAQVIEWADKWNPDDLAETTSKLIKQNGFLGVSSTWWLNAEPENIKLAREKLKLVRPDIKTVLGGARTFVDRHLYDHFIESFGEDPLIKLLNHGIGKIWHPHLEEESFHYGDAILPGEVLPMILGRGCRFACKFCSYELIGSKPGNYERTEENVLRDQESRLALGANSVIYIVDDTINESDIKLDLIKSLKKSDPNFGWGGYLRLDLIWAHRDKQINLLQETGLNNSFHGIESFHPKASQIINKGWNGKHAKSFLTELYSNCWDNKITTFLSFIAGLPHETFDDIKESVDWLNNVSSKFANYNYGALHLSKDDRVSKSEFEKNYDKYGYEFLDPADPENWTLNGGLTYRKVLEFLHVTGIGAAGKKFRVAYYTFFILLSLGYTVDEVSSMSNFETHPILTQDSTQRQEKKLQEYIVKFKSIHL